MISRSSNNMFKYALTVIIIFVLGIASLYACAPSTRPTIEASIEECLNNLVVQGLTKEAFEQCLFDTGTNVTAKLLENLNEYLDDYDLTSINKIISILFAPPEGVLSDVPQKEQTKEQKINRILTFIESAPNE